MQEQTKARVVRPKAAPKYELIVTQNRPEDSPKRLAIRLANVLQREQNARADAFALRRDAKTEERKALEMNTVLRQLREHNRKKAAALKAGEEWKRSRMDPFESYDEDAIKAERLMLIDRTRELSELANRQEQIAADAKAESLELQKQLAAQA